MVFHIKNILQPPPPRQSATVAEPCIEPLSQSPGNTLKLVPGFTSEIQYSESNYQKVPLTSMHSNPVSKHYEAWLLFLCVDSHSSWGNLSKRSALRAMNCHDRRKHWGAFTGISLLGLNREVGKKEEKKKRKEQELDNWGGSDHSLLVFPPWETHTSTHRVPPGPTNHWLPTEMLFVS